MDATSALDLGFVIGPFTPVPWFPGEPDEEPSPLRILRMRFKRIEEALPGTPAGYYRITLIRLDGKVDAIMQGPTPQTVFRAYAEEGYLRIEIA